MKLRNKTRASSRLGFLVKAVKGGFEYAGLGDTPIGVVTEIVASGAMCEIQTSGDAKVYVGRVVSEGADLRLTVQNEGGNAGVAYPVGASQSYTAIGSVVKGGGGLIDVALNISSAGVSGGGGGDIPTGGTTGQALLKNSATDYDVVWGSLPAGYTAWNIVDGIFDRAVNDGDQVEFLSGTDMQVQYSVPGGVHTLTFDYVGTPGTMDDWYLNVNTGADHTIQNHTQVDFRSGTYVTATYGFSAPRHQVNFELDTTATDGRYYTQTAADALFATQSWVTSNFDNYGSWEYEYDTSTPQSVTITTGLSFGLVPGTDIGFSWDGANRRQTINYTGTPGTMDDWYMSVEGGSDHTIANHGEVDFRAGSSNISVTYGFSSPQHRVIVDLSSTPSVASVTTTTGLYSNNLYERTGGSGINADGVLLKDNLVGVTSTLYSTTTSLYLGPTGGGTVYIRPSGYSSSTAQSSFTATATTIGNSLTVNGLTASSDIAKFVGTNTSGFTRALVNTVANVDAQFSWQEAGSTKWSAGNNADNDSFVIRRGFGAFGTNDHFWILTTGDAYFSDGVYAAGELESWDTSDIHLKRNIQDINYGKSARLLDVSTIEYDHIKKERHEIGLIAQEIQEIFPEVVREDNHGDLMVQYGKLIAPILQLVQNQEWRIRELERRVARY
jgi:hypothetical protein